MIKFLHQDEIWPRITELAKRTKKAQVAVAYFGQDGSRMLPLRPKSTLIVDCHPNSVKASRTCQAALLTLIKKGVEVHSCSNLHAKVFVFGKRAIIGSANASNSSKNLLLEAAVETTDKGVVEKCRRLIDSLRGDQISPKYASQLSKLWNPPKFKATGDGKKVVPVFHPLWVVPLVRDAWDEKDDKKDAEAEPEAKKKLVNKRQYELQKFHWEGVNPLLNTVKVGQQIIQAIEAKSGHRIFPPSRVIHLNRYKKDNVPQILVYLETPRVKPGWRSVAKVRKALGPLKKKLILKQAARRIRNKELAQALYQLWPRLKWDILET